jgi:hypothetical protein
MLGAQTTTPPSLSQQIQQLTDAMVRVQSQLEQSQRQLDEMRQQLAALQLQMAQQTPPTQSSFPSTPPASSTQAAAASSQAAAAPTASDIQEIRDRQAIAESQIATHEQTKVESESKYPIKITGLLLLNAFVNTRAVDMPATPTVAIPGSGSTGATVRQTVLGFDASGPHLFGARSYADLRVDFDGNSQTNSTSPVYTGYYTTNSIFLRLRTAHAGLQWQHTKASFSLDRPIFSPDLPTSLAAVAEPPLAWSGNLWTWNPQVEVTQDLPIAATRDLRFQAALIDVGDAPVSPLISSPSTIMPPTSAEQSRWPGVEARIALLGPRSQEEGSHLGVGGYFAPHLSPFGERFDSWAATLDTRLLLPARLQLSGSFYRGLALGGLGGGGYKDFAFRYDADSGGYYFRPLDDVGGWAQLKEKINERVQLNAAFGIDNVFAHELRRYAVAGGSMYQNLARNHSFTGNVIFSPSAYLLFSLEYRHLNSIPVTGSPIGANVIGVVAGYKF